LCTRWWCGHRYQRECEYCGNQHLWLYHESYPRRGHARIYCGVIRGPDNDTVCAVSCHGVVMEM
jgi:hypothetical protein